MKKILFVLLLLVSTSAFAGWFLIHSEYAPGTGWLCTYQLQGGNYQQTVVSQSVCSTYLN